MTLERGGKPGRSLEETASDRSTAHAARRLLSGLGCGFEVERWPFSLALSVISGRLQDLDLKERPQVRNQAAATPKTKALCHAMAGMVWMRRRAVETRVGARGGG